MLASLYKKEKDGLRCRACARRCLISEGKTGFCGVRRNDGGRLFLSVGSVFAHVDPIEKKPLYHFLPGSEIFSIGSLGCNFRCGFCQNFEISQASPAGALAKAGGGVGGEPAFASLRPASPELQRGERGEPEWPPERVAEFCREKKIPAIAFTYNEPTIFSEYAVAVMKEAKKFGLRGVFVSNGYETPEALDFLAPFIDAYNIDLKSFSEKFYQKNCGASLAPVLATLKEIYQRKKWLEITTLLIPGENDSEAEIKKAAEFIVALSPNIPWHLSAFFPTYKMQDKSPTPPETLSRAYEIGKKAGLNYVYTGNITDDEQSRTVCPKCGEILIERQGFSVKKIKIKNGRCPKCGLEIAGVWE